MDGDPFAGGEWCCIIVIVVIALIAVSRSSNKKKGDPGDENDYPFGMDDDG